MRSRLDLLHAVAGFCTLAIAWSDNLGIKAECPRLGWAMGLITAPLFFFMLLPAEGENDHQSARALKQAACIMWAYFGGITTAWLVFTFKGHLLDPLFNAWAWSEKMESILYRSPLSLLPSAALGCLIALMALNHGRSRTRSNVMLWAALSVVGVNYWLLASQVASPFLQRDDQGNVLGLPGSLDTVPLAGALIFLGNRIAAAGVIQTFSNHWVLGMLLSSATLFGVLFQAYDPAIDLNFRAVQSWPIAMLCGCMGIAAVFSGATLIGRHASILLAPVILVGRYMIPISALIPVINSAANAISLAEFMPASLDPFVTSGGGCIVTACLMSLLFRHISLLMRGTPC